MGRLRQGRACALLLGALLLAIEGVAVARTPPVDFFHAGVALVGCLLACVDFSICTFLSSLLCFYFGFLAPVTGWDVRPAALNAAWAAFMVLAVLSGAMSLLSCCCGDSAEDEGDASAKEAKPKKARRSMKAARRACAVVIVLLLILVALTQVKKGIYKLRVLNHEPGPVATSWKGFTPLSWEEAESKAKSVLVQMTASEKYSLLSGSGWPTGIIAGMEPEYGMYTGNTPAIPRLGIPSLNMQDAANGYRPFHDVPIGSTTSWPSLLALGATWDAQLVEEVASAIAREFRGKGANVLLGPSIQVHRTAWGGRNFEYMSGEDPYLGAVLAGAYVRGVQGEGVMAVAKHWAFNEQETNRFEYNVNVDQRTAWELYYPPFEAAVEAGVCAVMCAYNRVNGTHACTNDGILKQDLKGRMGFRGFVQSDWGATYAYQGAIKHGLDQDMPGNDHLWTEAVLSSLKPSAVDEAALRILAAIYRMKLDKNAWCTPPNCIPERISNQHTEEHQLLAAKAATEALVLLKNDGILPISKSKFPRIAVVGPHADSRCSATEQDMGRCMNYFGGGSGAVIPGNAVTPFEGIRERAQKEGISVSGVSDPRSAPEAVNAAQNADLVVVVGATIATEFVDRDVISPSLSLSDDVDSWISVVAATKPTVVLMQTPGAVIMPWLDRVNAVANLFLAGEQTGTAWASLLFGDASPEGKLPLQFPKTVRDTIPNDPLKMFEYTEGLFTSYRNPQVQVAFPFGHGLSFTTFTYGEPSIVKNGCLAEICVGMAVTNSGMRSGREVAQAYMEFEAAEETPRRILRGFVKTRLLQPGDTEKLLFKFTARDLSIYSVALQGWEVQTKAKVHFGASSADIRHELLLFDNAKILEPAAPKVSMPAKVDRPAQAGKTAEQSRERTDL